MKVNGFFVYLYPLNTLITKGCKGNNIMPNLTKNKDFLTQIKQSATPKNAESRGTNHTFKRPFGLSYLH